MSQKTTIKKDWLGLYVIAGGWIARPMCGTSFKEGDVVKSHHFGGSIEAGVTTLNLQFRKIGTYEFWFTTVINDDYNRKEIPEIFKRDFKKWEDYMVWITETNKNHYPAGIYEKYNQDFARNHLSK